MARGLDELAERLARHVHVAKDLAARAPPAIQAAVEHGHRRVSETPELLNRVSREALAIVVHDDGRCAARDAIEHVAEAIEREGRGEQRMGLRERGLVAHIEQRDLAPLDQGAANLGRRHERGGCHFNRSTAPIETAMQAAAAIVINTPAFAMSLIEK